MRKQRLNFVDGIPRLFEERWPEKLRSILRKEQTIAGNAYREETQSGALMPRLGYRGGQASQVGAGISGVAGVKRH